MQNKKRIKLFYELFENAPRQGPGSAEATKQALKLCRGLPEKPRILDIGCGVGAQTIVLAEATKGSVLAVDNHGPMLEHLRENAAALDLQERIRPTLGDMKALAALDLPLEGFDLIWSEGALFIMGFANALQAWRPYLRPGGCLAVSDMVWLRPDAPEACRTYLSALLPDLDDREAQRMAARAAGYEVLGDFALTPECWTDNYYTPLSERVPVMRAKYPGDPDCDAVLEDLWIEMEMYKKYGRYYGYQFLVLRRSMD